MHKISHFTLLGLLGLSVSAIDTTNAADNDNYGWGSGSPTGRVGARKVLPRSAAQAAELLEPLSSVLSSPPPQDRGTTPQDRGTTPQDRSTTPQDRGIGSPSSSSLRSASSEPVLSVSSSSLSLLQQENEELRRLLAQRVPAGAISKAFDPKVDAVLSFRWLNLFAGYPDPTSTNYDALRRQYYDANVFPFKQPLPVALKNQLGPEVTAWQARINAAREAYKDAYLDLQKKQARLARKAAEDLGNTIEKLDQSLLSAAVKADGKANKKEEILRQAQLDATNAERVFKEMQKRFLHEHPSAVQLIDGERQIVLLSPDDLDRQFTWGHIPKLLATPFTTLPGQRNDPNNTKGLYLTDPVDIQIGLYILEWMIPHLERELMIFRDIRTRYKKDFVPKVTGGYLSPAIWSDWYNGNSAKTLKDELKQEYPSRSIEHFPQPKTDKEETLRLLRRDRLGRKLREKFLDNLKRYYKIEVNELSEQYFSAYHGLDSTIETVAQTTYTTNKSGVQRRFPNSLSTPFLIVQARLQPPSQPELAEGNFPVPFVLPKKAQMATEYVSPKAMGFHRNLWPSVIRELLAVNGRNLRMTVREGGSKEYRRLEYRYEGILKELSTYLKSLQVSDSVTLPTPMSFFFLTPEQPQAITPEASIDLSDQEVIDRDLGNLRLLPNGQSEPVLHRYPTINLSGNNLQAPGPEAFSTSLTSLNVSRNKLRDLEFVVPFKELKELNVSEQLLNDLSPFGNDGVAPLPKLERLNLYYTGLSQINPLAGFSTLRFLDLSRNNIVTAGPLREIRTLEELDLSDNKITDIADLESLFKLRVLHVSRNPVQSLKSIVKLEALQSLFANECPFTGVWSTILPVAKQATDPRVMGLVELQLKGNPKIDWTPYSKKSAHSHSDVVNNNSEFNHTFPALKVLEVGSNTRLEASDGKAITLRDLEPRR